MSEPITMPTITGFKAYLEQVPVFGNNETLLEQRYGFMCEKCHWKEQGVYALLFSEHLPAFFTKWTENHICIKDEQK